MLRYSPPASSLITAVLACLCTANPASRAQARPAYSLAREGDFEWLEGEHGHTTATMRALEPRTDFVCLETAHFRIASTLAAIKPTAPADRKRFQADLVELRRLGYEVGRTTDAVDSRTRAHVYALRLENLYRDSARRLGVTDDEFANSPRRRDDPGYVGEGPHFGMRQRFLVMLCERETTLERYCATFVGRSVTHDGLRHFFRDNGALFFGAAVRGQHVSFESDQALHAAVVYSVTHALLDAFKYCWHETPFWLQEGFAHWQRRFVDADAELFTFLPNGLPERNRAIDWPTSVRRRVLLGNYTPLRDAIHWLEDRTIDYGDHLAIWSRVDFVLRKHPAAFGKLLRAIKGPEPKGPSLSPKPEQLVLRQIEALKSVFGWTPDEFDAAWCAFVKETYPRR